METFENVVSIVMAVVVLYAVWDYAWSPTTGTRWRWRTSGPSVGTGTPCPTCGVSVDLGQTDVTHENTPMESLGKSPARRSLNPYREIRRLKQEVADAVACRDETQRLLEMQYVSMVEVVKAVNYMSTTGIAIQTKVGKA